MIWVTLNMPSAVEECREPSGNVTLSGEWSHSADEYAVSWLTSYGSWHTYEKKMKCGRISLWQLQQDVLEAKCTEQTCSGLNIKTDSYRSSCYSLHLKARWSLWGHNILNCLLRVREYTTSYTVRLQNVCIAYKTSFICLCVVLCRQQLFQTLRVKSNIIHMARLWTLIYWFLRKLNQVNYQQISKYCIFLLVGQFPYMSPRQSWCGKHGQNWKLTYT